MAVELVTGAFINLLLERVIPRDFIAFLKTRRMDMGLVERLERSLNIICKVLDDAQDKQITCQRIKSWLEDLRDAAYLADDLLSEFHYEVTRSKVEAEQHTGDASAAERRSKKQLKKISRTIKCVFRIGDSSTGVKFSERQQERMKEIINRLEDLVKQKDALGLKDDGKKYSLSNREPMTCLVKEDDVFGRNEDKEEIMKLLQVNDDRSVIGVIRIVGMGGIGKTTLAQLVYGDSTTEELFKLRAWVCVSDKYDGFRVKGDILKQISKCGAHDQLSPERIDHLTPNDIDEVLKKALKDKKFLVVLDDMWHDNSIDWDRLLAPFKWGAKGSKIIVTTRDLTVASTVSVSTPYLLPNLEEEYCWQLFKKHAFNGENLDQRFVNTGREIVKKCQGSPLAVKMLGNQLRGEPLREWDRILKNNVWASQSDNVLSALMLSYQCLSPRLKQCFSYLAIFPKDYGMSKEEIIRLWVAEGFLVGNEGGRDMEELGEKCLHDLVSTSFLQKRYERGDVIFFSMHELINDLAKLISGKFVARMEVDSSSQISPKTRHLSCISGTMNMSSIHEAISKAQGLRNLLLATSSHWCWGDTRSEMEVLRDQISQLLCLRVLSLPHVRYVEELLDLFGNLKQLQYLDLSGTLLQRLPEGVCTLYNLQFLILCKCRRLVELPRNLRRLINLRCLDLRGTPNLQGMPQGMGNLKELRTLPKFSVGIQNCAKLDDLVELQHLQQELSIFNLQNVMETPRDGLMNKENLEVLELEWKGETIGSEHEIVIEKLKPCTSIKRLSIRGYGGRKFADWVGDSSYSNIVSISLKGCKYCTVLPTLGELLFLEYLSIDEFDAVTNVGVEFCKSSSESMEVPFCSLKTLNIEDMKQWEDWVICDSVNYEWFPKLKKLFICKCPKLKSISTCEPTHKIFKSLDLFIVSDCPNLKTSDLLAVSSFKELKMFGKGREVHMTQLPSKMYHLDIDTSFFDSEECNPRMEGYEEIMILFNALDFEYISIFGNKLLQSIPLEALPYLRHLIVFGCDKLESFSASEDPCLELYNCSNLKSLPQCMHNHLQSLKITSCGNLESFPVGGLPANLKSLEIDECDRLIGGRLQWGLQKLNALSHLSLHSYKGDDLDSFPERILLPPTLRYLIISSFPNMKLINYEGLQHLTSLVELQISFCRKLESLPEGLPSSLSVLEIRTCPLLEKRCERDKGEDWHKISHISTIEINFKTI